MTAPYCRHGYMTAISLGKQTIELVCYLEIALLHQYALDKAQDA
jgi:hypothetical protein